MPAKRPPTIGQRIRSAREAAALTQVDLAAAAGTTQDHISDVERDVHTPGLALLARLAKVLGVGLGELVE